MTRPLLNLLAVLLLLLGAGCASGRGSERAQGPLQDPPRFPIIERIGRAGRHEEKHGFINERGRVVIPPRFEYAHDFSEGLALVQLEDRLAFIRPDGAVAFHLPQECNDVGHFSEGLALTHVEGTVDYHIVRGGAWGYVDRSGRFAIPARFVVRPEDSYEFAMYGHFSEGLAAVPDPNGKWGFIDRTGRWAIPPQYDEARPFHKGLAEVHVYAPGVPPSAAASEGGWGYVDRTGRVVWTSKSIAEVTPSAREGESR